MKILGVDTSCDDTCVAVLEAKKQKIEILSNIISSQVEIHKKYGGVYPSLAKREHQRNLTFIFKKALSKSGLLERKTTSSTKEDKNKIQKLEEIFQREKNLFQFLRRFLGRYQKPRIDLISVTIGPGLEPCLWVGINFARALSYFWNIPVAPVNHIEAHLFANWLEPPEAKQNFKNQKIKGRLKNKKLEKIKFPAVCLIVSGGHTQLVLMKKIGKYRVLGETRDDAAGECLDKIARILGLSYPGGPILERLAKKAKSNIFHIKLPRPLFYSKDYDFSFSGLKTAVLYEVKKNFPKAREKREIYIYEMAKEAQQAIIDVLVKKTLRAARDFRVNSILLGGGVASNRELRKTFREKMRNDNFAFFAPSLKNCTDNAAMVAFSGFFHYKERDLKKGKAIKAFPNLRL